MRGAAGGGSAPGEEGFRGIGAVRGAGRASVPVPESCIHIKSQIISLLTNNVDLMRLVRVMAMTTGHEHNRKKVNRFKAG